METPPGTLFVVATPIGNLEDLTFRALRTLKEVDLVAAEDTRRTAKLLAHYEIRKPLRSLRAHNEAREAQRLVHELAAGAQIALVSDAGTPAIADPGFVLVQRAREAGLRVVPIPGVSAVTTALSVAGLDASSFVFLGFAPSRTSERTIWFDALHGEERLLVFFEAPHRMADTTARLTSLVNRPIIVGRELTKLHEEIGYIANQAEPGAHGGTGEFVVVVGPAPDRARDLGIEDRGIYNIYLDVVQLAKTHGLSDNVAVAASAALVNGRPQSVRKAVKRQGILTKRRQEAGES